MSLLLSDLGSAVSQHFPEKDQNEIFARDSHAPETLERRFTRLFVVTYTHSSRGGLCGRARRLRHRTYAAASVRRAETRACSRAATRFGRLTRGVEEKERKEKKPGDDTSQGDACSELESQGGCPGGVSEPAAQSDGRNVERRGRSIWDRATLHRRGRGCVLGAAPPPTPPSSLPCTYVATQRRGNHDTYSYEGCSLQS